MGSVTTWIQHEGYKHIIVQVEFGVHVHELGNGVTEYVLGQCRKM